MNSCKSLKVIARNKYDENNTLNYNFFLYNNSNSFKSIILRNSGNDFSQTILKDAFLQDLISDIGIDTQSYRPSILFINGEYWGIHNIREIYDEHYFMTNHNIDKSNLVLLEKKSDSSSLILDHGDSSDLDDYNSLIDFIKSNDMSNDDNYNYVSDKIDIDNFIKYTICQIYFANWDWPVKNFKIYRDNSFAPYTDNKWRCLLYDLDLVFMYSDHNTLETALSSTI